MARIICEENCSFRDNRSRNLKFKKFILELGTTLGLKEYPTYEA